MTTVLKASTFDLINDIIIALADYDKLKEHDIMLYNYDTDMIRFTVTRIEDGVLIFTGDIRNE